MPIAMVIASLGGGGAERVLLDIVKTLPERGIKAEIITLEHNVSFAIPPHISVKCLTSCKQEDSLFRKACMLPIALFRLWRKLRKRRYRLVIGHMERANGLVLLTPFHGKKALTIHNYLSNSVQGKKTAKRLYARLLYYVASWCKIPCIFVSEAAREDGVDHFHFPARSTFTIPNVVDVDAIRNAMRKPLSRYWQDICKRPVILTAGRLEHQKGHWHLIRAFREVQRTIPSALLVILGEGSLRSALETYVDQLGLTGNVLLPGFMPNPYALMHQVGVFVLPSLYEGMPIILLEALACQSAIIATDCQSGPREVLAPGTILHQNITTIEITPCGILTPRLDGQWHPSETPLSKAEEALSTAMITLLRDKNQREALAAAAAQRSFDYSIHAGVKRWESFIANILETSPSRHHQ